MSGLSDIFLEVVFCLGFVFCFLSNFATSGSCAINRLLALDSLYLSTGHLSPTSYLLMLNLLCMGSQYQSLFFIVPHKNSENPEAL